MARSVFAVLVLSVLVAGAFAGLFSSSSSNSNNNQYNNGNKGNLDQPEEQIQRQHKKNAQQDQPDTIRQCTRDEQRAYFRELKQHHQQCQQQCEQEQVPRETQDAVQTVRECSRRAQRQALDALDCIDRKTQEQGSASDSRQQRDQVENEDSSAKFADHFERMTQNARQQMEEAYEEQQNTRDQKFGKLFANQIVDCTNKCVVRKARQTDNAQRYGCEIRFESEQLKQAIGECQQRHLTEAIDEVCQCATNQNQQNNQQTQRQADEYCQNLKQKKFDVEQLFSQY